MNLRTIPSSRRVGWSCPACGHMNEPGSYNCDSEYCREPAKPGTDPESCLHFGVMALIPRLDENQPDRITGFIIKDGTGDVVAIIPRNDRTACVTAAIARHLYDRLCGRK